MKKLLLMAIVALMVSGVSAQGTIKKIRAYEGNSIVFERYYDDVDSVVFTNVSDISDGAFSGKFSISASKQVVFSRGNLQYVKGVWQFAENQYDVFGSNNSTATCTMDLFGWGTGDNPFQKRVNPTNNNYYAEFVEWGTNAIYNGGNTANIWRTLTQSEWSYLVSHHKGGQATVNGVHGIILLPSNWTDPTGLSIQRWPNNWTTNQYSIEEWRTMESFGAVFLPCAGYRDCGNDGVNEVGSMGYYWTTSFLGGNLCCALCLIFNESSLKVQADNSCNKSRCLGMSVRLVKEVR